MTEHCLLCGAPVSDEDSYRKNEARYVRQTRYQHIVDVLLDAGRYDAVYFDHDTELTDPYRGVAFHKRNALQIERGKGRDLHKKWPDVVAVKGDVCDIVIEEEREPGYGKIEQDIGIVTACKYLWVDGNLYQLVNPCLFVLVSGFNVAPKVDRNVGTFSKVVVCGKADFSEMYTKHYLNR